MIGFTRSMMKASAIAMGLAGLLAAATPSLAQTAHSHAYYYEPGDNGSAWSYYRGYTDHASARGAYAQVPRYSAPRSLGRIDNPPGSAFEDEGNSRSMGCPC
jgi:hypothetical protein